MWSHGIRPGTVTRMYTIGIPVKEMFHTQVLLSALKFAKRISCSIPYSYCQCGKATTHVRYTICCQCRKDNTRNLQHTIAYCQCGKATTRVRYTTCYQCGKAATHVSCSIRYAYCLCRNITTHIRYTMFTVNMGKPQHM